MQGECASRNKACCIHAQLVHRAAACMGPNSHLQVGIDYAGAGVVAGVHALLQAGNGHLLQRHSGIWLHRHLQRLLHCDRLRPEGGGQIVGALRRACTEAQQQGLLACNGEPLLASSM